MIKLKLFTIVLVSLCVGCVSAPKLDSSWQGRFSGIDAFKKNQRILILAPHPDDESIACAGIIQKALRAGAWVKIVYLTNGDHNEFAFIVYEKRLTMRQGEFIYLGGIRQKESIKAMNFLGLAEKDLVFLGYPDYGTFNIFCKYWLTASEVAPKPFRDRLTRISSVPYKKSPSYGAKYYGENILADLTKQVLEYQPDKIFVSHPADVNVDHKTLYLFLQVVLSDLEARLIKPEIYTYLVHCAGWPKPRHYHPELELCPPDKFIGSDFNWLCSGLSPQELDKKYQSILYYKSQTQSSAFYLFSFARKNELFSDCPELRLTTQSTLEDKNKTGTVIKDQGSASYTVEDNYLILRLNKPKKFNGRFGVMWYIFGYSKSTLFAQMPKVCIITRGNKVKVFSSKERVINSGVLLNFEKDLFILKIPLKFLGQPDYTLMALKAYHGNLPIDAMAFRKVKISQ